MSVLAFIGKMGVAEAGGVASHFANMLVKFDPETASKVDIDNMKVEFAKFGDLVSKEEPEEERTHQIATGLEANLARTIQAAGMLSGQIDKATADGNTNLATSLSTQLITLTGQIEELGGDPADGTVSGRLFEARQDHALAEKDLHNLQILHKGAAAALLAAEQRLQHAKSDMDRASREEASAKLREARAEQMAGLKTSMDGGHNVALEAMEAQAAVSKQKARAFILNADALSQATSTTASADDIVARTLAGSGGGAPVETAQEKLNRLLGKKAA